jgi:hypothetical protein
MVGRPKTFTESRHVSLRLELASYSLLAGDMLRDYQGAHPHASISDLLRSLLEQAIADYRRLAAERSGAAERERARLHEKLCKLLAAASEDNLESTARKMAELIK